MHISTNAHRADHGRGAIAPALSVTPSQLHIYTQNAYGLPLTRRAERFRALARLVQDLAPDVAFLQEVMFAGDEEFFRIDGYHRAFLPNGVFNCGGLLTLSKTPLAVVRFHPFRSQGAWHNRQLSDRFLGKGWLEATAPEWGITLVNTHLVSTYRESGHFVHDSEQHAQLEQVLIAVARLGPSILAGDFNFTEDTPFHRLAVQRLEDVTRGLHPWGLRGLQPKIDHIFVSGFEWIEARARRVPPGVLFTTRRPYPVSDHAGVSVELALSWQALPKPADRAIA